MFGTRPRNPSQPVRDSGESCADRSGIRHEPVRKSSCENLMRCKNLHGGGVMLDVKASSCWKALNSFVAAAAISFGLGRAEDISAAMTERVNQLIGQLDDESYAVRQKATKELADIGP